MWSMTFQTTVYIRDDAMLVYGVFSSILYVLMTSVAQVGREVFNHLCITGAMWIMATDAVVLGRFVDKLIFL